MLSASENDLSVRSHARVMSADESKVCGVDARIVRLSSLLCVLYVGACAFFVRHLKCVKVINFHVSVPVQLYVSSPKQIWH
jgi:hypothetical protein